MQIRQYETVMKLYWKPSRCTHLLQQLLVPAAASALPPLLQPLMSATMSPSLERAFLTETQNNHCKVDACHMSGSDANQSLVQGVSSGIVQD